MRYPERNLTVLGLVRLPDDDLAEMEVFMDNDFVWRSAETIQIVDVIQWKYLD
jgi:hypothetical protein